MNISSGLTNYSSSSSLFDPISLSSSSVSSISSSSSSSSISTAIGQSISSSSVSVSGSSCSPSSSSLAPSDSSSKSLKVFKNVEEIELCKKAAMEGSAGAQCQLGCYYYKGNGVEKNPAKAFKWFREAAINDNPSRVAQFNLGLCYLFGNGVEKYPAKAFAWFSLAAEAGDLNARYNVAMCYGLGEGIPQNFVRCIELLSELASRNHVKAQSTLDELLKKGYPVHRLLNSFQES